MSTSASSPGTPGSPQHCLNQTYGSLPLLSHAISRAPAPRLAHKSSSSTRTVSELMPGVKNVNRLWSLFENALHEMNVYLSGEKVIDQTDENISQPGTPNDRVDIDRVVHRAQHGGLSVLDTLSYSERGLALIVALREGSIDVIGALLNKNTDLYAADEQGLTALRVAAETGQLKTLAYLLKRGCSIEPEPSAKDRRNAIECAEQSGQITAAVMMGLYTNIRLSMIEADHPYRHYKGETPVKEMRHRHLST